MTIQQREATVLREYGPFGADKGVHGVTFDGKLVWFAQTGELVAFDPDTEKEVRRMAVPSAGAGTAFDGEHIYQLAAGSILVVRPSDGRVLRTMPAPGKGEDSGMAYADGYLWIGQYRASKINQVDAKTGEVVKTLSSDRWVTGVSCFGGAIWHATDSGEGRPSELRRLADDGSVTLTATMPAGIGVSGLEAAGDGTFWCGGGASGKLRRVKP